MEAVRKRYSIIDEAIKNECMETKSKSQIWSRVRAEEMQRLYDTQIYCAEERGEQRGIEQGIEQNKINVILTMYNQNFTIETISKVVNMSKERIEEILKNENVKEQ